MGLSPRVILITKNTANGCLSLTSSPVLRKMIIVKEMIIKTLILGSLRFMDASLLLKRAR